MSLHIKAEQGDPAGVKAFHKETKESETAPDYF